MSESKAVRLGELDHDPIAVAGKEARYQQLDDLKVSLPAQGQLQSLNVRPAGQGARAGVVYWVKAGNRRLASLRALRDAKAEILGVVVTDDFPVHVIFGEADDTETFKAMVAENVQRLAPTPMEEARDFAKMVKSASVKEIALQFGVKPRYVEQRIKLSALHPAVQAALEAGKIDLESAEAFTLEQDPERQAKYLRSAKQDWNLRADRVRAHFTDKLVATDSSIAKLIGKKAYEAAGGQIMADSFGDRGYWVSREIIDKLLDAHWAEQEKAWKADGWAWVADAAEYQATYGLPHYLGRITYNADHKFKAAEKAYSGVVFWRDGDRQTILGVIDVKKARPPKTAADTPAKAAPSLDQPGDPVLMDLTARLTRAAQLRVAGDAMMALVLLYAGLSSQMAGVSNPPVMIAGNRVGRPTDGAAKGFSEALEWAKQQSVETLLVELAKLVGAQVTLNIHGQGSADQKKAVVDYVDPPIGGSHFDPADYFASITKPLIALAWGEMTGGPMADGKKGDMAAQAAAKAKETGWLPPQLRTPSYVGPGKPNPLAAKPKARAKQLEAAE